ncbi:MAG TPA: archease [Chromatiales bacterium]|nr:archease [Chromatiales bacterium]
MPAHWEHFHHMADIGVRGYGTTLAEAFEQVALGMMAVLTDVESIAPRTRIDIRCQAPDPELLLVDWLNALIYEMATRNMVFGRFSVSIAGPVLQGEAWGETLQPHKHHPGVELKGATYTALKVARLGDGSWLAQCVVDV